MTPRGIVDSKGGRLAEKSPDSIHVVDRKQRLHDGQEFVTGTLLEDGTFMVRTIDRNGNITNLNDRFSGKTKKLRDFSRVTDPYFLENNGHLYNRCFSRSRWRAAWSESPNVLSSPVFRWYSGL